VVGSCLLCCWGCWWPQKLFWLLGSITDFQPKFTDGQSHLFIFFAFR
jgi:hypothetical protein